ncbi:potassium-transporting ATPase subunit KdpC [Agreia pratensis]|uniref:Potassium-transporting ATPase KdpC subunit n=1 Tax=Agreia pratensis TaxID=150121 RepID=A0A1X7L562_9MICO|nr:potassium-transporting ATPase subunit KdpC [Agreia pratensis]MBF4636185.1 potassium-transporting ATPase subunit KdpC [Agreia pratensis]SMG48199.1 K+-transporting ATPase ATPase C chain [Agreia pratensis]
MSSRSRIGRQYWVALRAMVVFTLVLGVGYTAVVTGIGQLALPAQADGQPVSDADGQVVGSALIGQSFTDADGNALPQWFQSRPSAAGSGYDGTASSGSNLGPENSDLITAIGDRRAAVAKLEGVSESEVPADAVTASASGLDPQISPEYARLQVARVAEARDLPEAKVSALVESFVQGRDLGILGDPTVNVLELNLALASMAG